MTPSEMPSDTPPTSLGKRKFIESFDEFESDEGMNVIVAHRRLGLPDRFSGDYYILSKYKEKCVWARYERKERLDLAYEAVTSFRNSKFLLENGPKQLRVKASSVKLKQMALGNLCSNIYAHFEVGKFSDFAIYCQERSWKVHRLVLCSSSEYFDTCLSNSIFQESQQSAIRLDDDEPEMINQLITFFYTCEYNSSQSKTDQVDSFKFHVKMYIIADKYGVFILKSLARQNLETVLEDMKSLKPNIAAFVEAVKLIYGTVLAERDSQIRDMFTKMLKKHQVALKKNREFKTLIKLGLGTGVFDRDVVKALLDEN